MGPQPDPDGPTRDPEWSVLDAEAAGLTVVGLREFRGRMECSDMAAVVHFLRKVIWIVPGFTVEAYRDRLRSLYDRIQAEGSFVAASVRFLIGACSRRGSESAPGAGSDCLVCSHLPHRCRALVSDCQVQGRRMPIAQNEIANVAHSPKIFYSY